MTVRLMYFANVREQVGIAAEDLELPAEVRTVGALRTLLRARGGGWTTAFAEGRVVRTAVNQSIAKADAPVAPGDEIAFFPPVTGG